MKNSTKFTLMLLSALISMKGLKAQDSAKGSLFLGFEAGINIADDSPYNDLSAQGGVTGEYFFARQWSVLTKVKFNQTNVNKYRNAVKSTTSGGGMGPNLTGMFDEDEKFLSYQSSNITVPINLKWNFRISEPVYASLNAGPTFNLVLDSQYKKSGNLEMRDPKAFLSYNFGMGFHLKMKNDNVLYTNYDYYRGANLATFSSLITKDNAVSGNHHFSVGYLWKLR